MDDRRPIIQFHAETANRLENNDDAVETRKESGMNKKRSASRGTGRAGGGPQTADNESTEDGEKPKREEKNPEGRPAPGSAEAPLATELEDDLLPAAAEAPEEAPDASDMLPFSLDSPGGTCVASLSLMSLGMLNVHISIPNHIVVVDSNLVDTDTVKR